MQTLTTQFGPNGLNEAAMESLVGNTGVGREQAGGEEKRRKKVKVEVKSYV